MHWQYYQKALAASLAAFKTIGVQAQFQDPMVLPGDGGFPYHWKLLIILGTQADSVFSGIATFGRIPYRECFGRDKHEKFDIAILGAPFDTGTSYRSSSEPTRLITQTWCSIWTKWYPPGKPPLESLVFPFLDQY